jgi:anti-sigma factor RsiW
MDPEKHAGELAEAYALGALEADERDVVEAHIAQCPACSRRVGEAEEALLALERGTKLVKEPPGAAIVLPNVPRRAASWWALPAFAAAFILGLLFSHFSPQSNVATLAMIHSHFSHAQFSGAPGAPAAKVLYARDRSWYYVIVAGSRRFDVYGLQGRVAIRLGATEPRDATSELFARSEMRFDRIELRENANVVEGAAIR